MAASPVVGSPYETSKKAGSLVAAHDSVDGGVAEAAPPEPPKSDAAYVQVLQDNTHDGRVNLDQAVKQGVPRRAAVAYGAGWIVGGGQIEATKAMRSEAEALASKYDSGDTSARSSCRGKNTWDWIPPSILLDSCNTRKLLNILSNGGDVLTVGGALAAFTGVPGIIASAVGAYLVVNKWVLSSCSKPGRGIRIFNGPVPGIFLCWPQ